MPASRYRGAAVMLGIGSSFALVGSVPLAITLGLGVRSSATVIGVGFIGFGIMLIVPAIMWCAVLQYRPYRHCWRNLRNKNGAGQEETPALVTIGDDAYGGMEEYQESSGKSYKPLQHANAA